MGKGEFWNGLPGWKPRSGAQDCFVEHILSSGRKHALPGTYAFPGTYALPGTHELPGTHYSLAPIVFISVAGENKDETNAARNLEGELCRP